MHDNHIALLLTEKKINFPLINMGVKSASTKIRLKSEAEKSRYSATLSSISHSTSVRNSEINPDIEPILEKLSTKMVYFLGPAAPLVLEDCLKQWKEKYIQSKENLPHLIELIQKELDSEGEKNEFYIATNIMINKTVNQVTEAHGQNPKQAIVRFITCHVVACFINRGIFFVL